MNSAFSGRAAPMLVHESRTWLNLVLLSGASAAAFSLWGSPGFHRSQFDSAGFAALTATIIHVINLVLLPRSIPKLFAEDGWKIGQELVYNSWVILTALVGTGLSPQLFGEPFQATDHWYSVVIPLSWFFLVSMTATYQVLHFRKNFRRALHIQSGIRKRTRLSGDKDREFSFKVLVNGEETTATAYDIIYLHHTDQQTTIAFRNSRGEDVAGSSPVDFRMVREKIRKLSNFYRCHREWTVNMDKVIGIKADALGFQLESEMKEMRIPVSSSLNDDLEGRLMK